MAHNPTPARPWWRELGLLVATYAVYRQSRIAVTGSRHAALTHARQLVAAERSLGLFVEGAAHRAALSHPAVLRTADLYYGTVHFLVPAAALLVLFRRCPDRYRQWRNVFGWMLALGILVFAAYPVLPPNMLPASFHIGGPVRIEPSTGGFGWSADNPYAAMPSLHVAWATWCALALWPLTRTTLARVALAAYPALTLAVVVGTANHYLLDAAGGWVVLGVAYGAERLRRAVRDAPAVPTDPGPEPEPLTAQPTP